MHYKTRLLLIHLLGILAFLSIPVFTSPDFGENLLLIDGFKRDFSGYVLLMVFFYVNYYYFMPKYYFTKRRFLYCCFVFFCFAMVTGIPDLLFPMHFHGGPPTMQGPMNGRPPMNNFFNGPAGSSFFQFLLVLSLSFTLKINNQLTEMYSEKLKAEVSYLKAQINPHFLFNTLNSLYALTIEKSDAAPDAVIKLSNMMRYVVTESTNDLVPLEKEVSYITDYIDMQRLRIPEDSNLEYTVIGNAKGKSIAPMVIIPFIENAFKYGINSEEDWHIAIAIEILDNHFILDVTNNKVKVSFPDDHATEQGIENTTKRLEFIYPGKHEIYFDDEPQSFHVHLKINLS
jgi:uncharacterized protein YlzI (FlbEa/FlbD family)